MDERLEKTDTRNQGGTRRGKVAHQYDDPTRKPPTYRQTDGELSPGTGYRLDDCQAVKSSQIGDGTGSGTPND